MPRKSGNYLFELDVSKDRSTVCTLRSYGEIVVAPFEVKHTNSECICDSCS